MTIAVLLMAVMAEWVDPKIGAVTYPETGLRGDEAIHGFGKTFPGAATPFGRVQLSPDTVTGGDNGPGYSYTHTTIEGFSFFHMSGIGWYGEFGNFQVMPGETDRSVFSHDEEKAETGYYRVRLPDAGVVAELTAAQRAGMIRFTWEKDGTGTFKIDLARRIGELTRAKPHGRQTFRLTGANAFEGEIVCDHRDGGWGRGRGKVDYTVRFKGLCSKSLDNCVETGGETNRAVRFRFPVRAGESVVLHVAFDFCGTPEAPVGLDFDGMRAAAWESWQKALGAIEISGGTDKQRRIFATALYHAMLDPREIGQGEGFTRRTVFSGWDVFRSEMPLLTLIRPDVVSDTISSLMETVTSGKRKTLPRWDVFGCESGCMLGQPLVSVMAAAYERGIRTFDAEMALALAQSSLEAESNDRRLGFTPGSLSATLEYAYHDWCCGRLAQMMGRDDIARKYFGYAEAYTNCWSSEVGWMRARTADGGWLKWEGREKHGQGCAESNPWQQGWFVPHDPDGLVRLMGGRARFTEELEKFFAAVPEDFRWNDAYNHPNEPCHTLPYLWALSDRPEEVGRWTRRICEQAYGDDPFGLCGNDDVGQMSAWYVLSAIGLHPLCPGDGRWYVTAPLFSEVKLHLDGHTFVIRAPGAETGAWKIRALRLNGKALDRNWLTTAEIVSGGTLDVTLVRCSRVALFSGYDGKWCKVQPSIASDGKKTALLTYQMLNLSGTDVFSGQYVSKSSDGGATWSDPTKIPESADVFERGLRVARYVNVSYSNARRKWYATGLATMYDGNARPYRKFVDGRPYCYPVQAEVDAEKGTVFIAEFDPERRCLKRETEQAIVPERGARLGNFSVASGTAGETSLVTAEWMQPKGCEKYGSDNSLWFVCMK